jgi:hypothetical protein
VDRTGPRRHHRRTQRAARTEQQHHRGRRGHRRRSDQRQHRLAGSVNGGVWRTDDLTAANPRWRPLTDQQLPFLDINSLAISPVNHNAIFAGGGLSNSFGATAIVNNCLFRGNEAIGGQGIAGSPASDGLGGGIANSLGVTLVVTNCTLGNNLALGGPGGSRETGGNAFGAGVYNDGQSTLSLLLSASAANAAICGAAGSAGNAGPGIGGCDYFASGGIACLDLFTSMNITGNTALHQQQRCIRRCHDLPLKVNA